MIGPGRTGGHPPRGCNRREGDPRRSRNYHADTPVADVTTEAVSPFGVRRLTAREQRYGREPDVEGVRRHVYIREGGVLVSTSPSHTRYIRDGGVSPLRFVYTFFDTVPLRPVVSLTLSLTYSSSPSSSSYSILTLGERRGEENREGLRASDRRSEDESLGSTARKGRPTDGTRSIGRDRQNVPATVGRSFGLPSGGNASRPTQFRTGRSLGRFGGLILR